MKRILKFLAILLVLLPLTTYALIPFSQNQGGTGNAGPFNTGGIFFQASTAKQIQDDAHLFWDDNYDNLRVGTTSDGTSSFNTLMVGEAHTNYQSDDSLIVGNFNTNATSPFTITGGEGTQVIDSPYSIAVGTNVLVQASGAGSGYNAAFGKNHSIDGSGNLAGGIAMGSVGPSDNNLLTGNSNNVHGNNNALSGTGVNVVTDNSLTAGDTVNNNGLGSIAVGNQIFNTASYSGNFGASLTNASYASTDIGQFNAIATGTTGSWVTTEPVFQIGIGTSSGSLANALTALKNGKIGIGSVVAPSAMLHIQGGTATAGTAPLKINSGTLLGTTEAGAIENNGTHLFYTAANGGTRFQLDQQAATSPGGLNAQLQYNNAGVFGGITGATTNGTTVSLDGAHLLNPTINGAGVGLATLVYPNTASSATITFPTVTGTLATLAGTEALTNKSVNGVILTTGGSTSSFLNANGVYSTPTGTVSSFAFTDGSGFDGTVSTATTTPTLSLTTQLTSGSVPYIAAAGALSQDNSNFFYDPTNHNLRIGPTSASITTENAFALTRTANDYFGDFVQNASNGALASTDRIVSNDLGISDANAYFDMGCNSSGNTNAATTLFAANDCYLFTGPGGGLGNINIATGTTGKVIKFGIGGLLTANEIARFNATGLGIGTTTVTGRIETKGTTAMDGPTQGAELLTSSGWTSTNWTGSFGAGWAHTIGNTTGLLNTLAAVNATRYQVSYTVTGRTAGSFVITFGGVSNAAATATGTWGPTSVNTGTLSIVPTTDFDGTIVISIKTISTASTSTINLWDSGNTLRFETRVSNQSNNLFLGLNSGRFNTTGTSNLGVGMNALQNNTTATNNLALGANALAAVTTGASNTAIGTSALQSATTAGNNFALGFQSLSGLTTGANNIGIGLNAFLGLTTSGTNVTVGSQGGRSITSGSGNTFIGDSAGFNASQLVGVNNSMALGSGTYTAASNQIVLGNTSITSGGIGVINPTAIWQLKAGTATASTAPLKFSSGTNLTTAEVGAMEFDGTNLFFTPTGTIRKSIPTTVMGRQTAQTAADATVVTATVGAADASYEVSANVLVTTSTVHSFTATVAYTDEGNTARTLTLQFSTLAGAFVTAMTNAQGTVPYEGVPEHIRAKGGTTITIATTGTFTTVTYNVEGSIMLKQ